LGRAARVLEPAFAFAGFIGREVTVMHGFHKAFGIGFAKQRMVFRLFDKLAILSWAMSRLPPSASRFSLSIILLFTMKRMKAMM